MAHWITALWITVNLLYYTSNKKPFTSNALIRKSTHKQCTKSERKKLILINYKQEVENIFSGKNELEFTLNTKLSRNGEDNLKEGIHFVFRHQSETQKRFSKQNRRMKVLGNFSFFLRRSRLCFEHSLLKMILVRRAGWREAKEFNGPLFSTVLDSTAAKKLECFLWD